MRRMSALKVAISNNFAFCTFWVDLKVKKNYVFYVSCFFFYNVTKQFWKRYYMQLNLNFCFSQSYKDSNTPKVLIWNFIEILVTSLTQELPK